MKLNTDAKPPRSAGTSTETKRGRWPLSRAMTGAWGALGGRRSSVPPEPTGPSPEALAQLARARDILQQDRASAAQVASVRTTRERLPSPAVLDIAGWIADEADEPQLEVAAHPVSLDPISAVRTRLLEPDARRAPDDDGATFDMAALAGLADELEPDDASEPAAGPGDVAVAVDPSDPEPTNAAGEPIRTRTMARLLASQGYVDRALVIYEHLLAEAPDDDTLRVEVDKARALKPV
ncbi:MAG: hypothetical protein ABW252_02760 [Polyangiales bacterium]